MVTDAEVSDTGRILRLADAEASQWAVPSRGTPIR
jgi:hypothetical protein